MQEVYAAAPILVGIIVVAASIWFVRKDLAKRSGSGGGRSDDRDNNER
jgi:hypothetical protein